MSPEYVFLNYQRTSIHHSITLAELFSSEIQWRKIYHQLLILQKAKSLKNLFKKNLSFNNKILFIIKIKN